ncbi:ABC transporter permease subunit [Paracoccus sp. S-4012]|uniref:ABC transporter permease n=1 Tax=Paracoccus sp. S-4012 TaxID=2665648 RepID=UPI0012B15499|nr:ABC transporter permease [Paracoccus sp. S-4012]MRX50109.1 ABC transporter permease subunit [Paracoccus sp. S-4012]
MILHAVERILQTLLVILIISFIAFMLIDTLGDPLGLLLPPDASLAERQALTERLGLDRPLLARFAEFLAGLPRGDLGISYRTQEEVSGMIAARLPATIELAAVALLISLVVAIPAGIYTGVFPRSRFARAIMFVSIAGVTLPNFVVGILLIAIFSVQLGWFPSFGRGATIVLGGWETGLLTRSGWHAIILPALTLSLFQMTFIIRLLRTQLMEIGRSEHIRFARARGLGEARLWFVYALRNALLPTITMLALQLGNIIAFSVVTESVFAWPGIGTLFLQSVQAADIRVIAIYLIFVGIVYMVINLLVELLYPLIDPRLRQRHA